MGLGDFLFGKTTAKPVSISKPLQTSLNTTAGQSLDRYRLNAGRTLDSFRALTDRTLPQIEGAIQLGQNDLNTASRMVSGYNPMGTYERIRGGNLTALQSLADSLAGIGRRQEGALAARLGMAGRPASSARDLIRASGTATAMSPLAQTIFANLGNDTSGISRDVMNQAQGLRALASARPDLYSNLYNLALAPLSAEQQALGGETSALSALAQAARNNFAGMDVQKKMGLFDFPVRMTEALGATVGNVAGAVGDVAGAVGAINGMGGGYGGGYGPSNPNLNWNAWSPMGGMGYGGYSPYTGGLGNWFSQPSAMNVNTMNPLQLMMLDQARRSAALNVPAGSVWE